MRRREFIVGLAGVGAAWPLPGRAQETAQIRKIAVWLARADNLEGQRLITAFRQRLQVLGWAEGRNIRTDYRWVVGDSDRIRTIAQEIVEQQPEVILVESTPGVAAVSRESRTVPIVFVNVSDPIGSGFVASLARPAGAITGFISNEPTLGGKWLELIKEIAPMVGRIGFMFNPDTASYAENFLRHAEAAARFSGIQFGAAPIHNDAEIDRAISALAGEPLGGLIVLPEATTSARSDLIIGLAARYRVPAIYAFGSQAAGGGLMSYGVDLADAFRSAAVYVDRILRGGKAADLPVQAPTKFVMVVNLKAATALGLTVPLATLLRADEVIN
jgi:putative ABC transport system substrate-binding protein